MKYKRKKEKLDALGSRCHFQQYDYVYRNNTAPRSSENRNNIHGRIT